MTCLVKKFCGERTHSHTSTISFKNTEDLSYSRLDVSFIYKFLDRKVVGEAGLSILNLLNNQNIKYTNFERIPSGQNNSINVYAEAIPFTPTLYLKFSMNNPE